MEYTIIRTSGENTVLYEKMKWIIIIIIGLLIGCTTTKELTMQDLRKGTNGITWKFLGDQPPSKVIENDRFVMTLELHNDGAAAAQNAVVTIGAPQEYIETDLESATLNRELTNLQFGLEGKSLKNPAGDISLLMIPAATKEITTSKKQSVTLTAQLCYDYETVAETSVCVNYHPAGYFLRITPCKPKAVTFSSQGAPVAVTKIDVKPKFFPDNSLGSSFTITIQNKGTGKVVETGQSNALCSATGDLPKIWDKVFITAVLGGKEIRCKKEMVRLENNRAEVVCEGALDPTRGPYVAPLQVYLDYGYTQTLSQQMTIERIV